MFDAIRGARRSVHAETYILGEDATGREFLDLLIQRAQDGISVRLIFDAIGSRGLDRHRLEQLLVAGGEFVVFNPPSRWFWRFNPRQRDHRKILLVDESVGFLGGLNIADEYVNEEGDEPSWRDAHARIEGPVLRDLQALFLENWFRSGGRSFEWRPLLDGPPALGGNHSIAILADGPMYSRRRLRAFFLDELRRARSQVLLVSPYFAPGPRVLEAIADASDRGVEVELLLAGQTDHPLLRRAARFFLPGLIKRGVRVYEDRRRMMHAKLAVFDGQLSVVGTSNLDHQSLDHSAEVNAIFEGPDVANWIREHFSPQLHGVVPIDSAGLASRGTWSRLIDRIAAYWLDN